MRKQDFIEIFFTSLPLFCYGPNSWASSSPSLTLPSTQPHRALLASLNETFFFTSYYIIEKTFLLFNNITFFPIDFVIVVSPLPLHRKNILTYFFSLINSQKTLLKSGWCFDKTLFTVLFWIYWLNHLSGKREASGWSQSMSFTSDWLTTTNFQEHLNKINFIVE